MSQLSAAFPGLPRPLLSAMLKQLQYWGDQAVPHCLSEPQDSSQADKHSYSPSSSLPGWLVGAESRIIPTGDEPKNTEIKQRNIFFYQIVPFTRKPLLLSGTYGSWMPWMCSKHSRLWEPLNVTSSWDRFHQQGCALLCHSSAQQPLGNEWHSWKHPAHNSILQEVLGSMGISTLPLFAVWANGSF